jgi:hypothetical protein
MLALPNPGKQGSMSRYSSLIVLLLAGMAGGAGEPSSDLDRARKLFLQERYEEALPLFRRASQAPEVPADALFHEAECLRILRRYPTAVSRYRRLIERTKAGTDADGMRAQVSDGF